LAEEVVIQARDLVKLYRDFWGRPKVLAVNKLNLDVRRGEVFGLLGPNGSGKTTTVKLLLGLLFPTRGVATVLGRPSTDVDVKARIGFLPEESYLYRFLNAEETLDFYGRLFRIPKPERVKRVRRLIDIVGLEHARKRPLKEFSKGMSRRIGLAQALINDPEIIFLDEPTSGLDPIGTHEMKDLIIQLRNQGKTVLLCSHLLADVQDVCDRIAILNRGVAQAVGPVKDLLTKKDVIQILARDLDDTGLEAVKAAVAQHGELVNVDHPTTTLEELFLSVIGKSNANLKQAAEPKEPEQS